MSPLSTRSLRCRLEDLNGAPLQRFEVTGRHIVVATLGTELVALDDTCSHERVSLTVEGGLDAEAREIECCRHGARFATTGLRTYQVVIEDGEVFIEVPEA